MKTRAILIERHGPPEVLVEREVPLAAPGPGQVHVAVRAAGVNFADLMMRLGLYSTVPPKPYSPGFEVSGVVAGVGPGVSAWKEGDKVVGMMRYGGYARDVILRESDLFPYPEPLEFDAAAALPVVALTAWACIFDRAHAEADESILILGAAGGVGTAAVQLAVDQGLRVIGTAGGERKCAFVTEQLSAHACLNSKGDWPGEVRAMLGERGLDIAMDAVGARATAHCRRLLAPRGRLIFYGLSAAAPTDRRNWPRVAWAWLRTPRFHPLSLIEPNISLHGVHLLHYANKEDVLRRAAQDILQRVREGRLRAVLDRSFPLDRAGAAAAHAHLHARRNIGKVVLVNDGS